MIAQRRPPAQAPSTVYFVTNTQHAELTADDHLAVDLLSHRGITVVPYVWTDPVRTLPPASFLVVRSVWDYHLRSEAFLRWVAEVEDAGHHLFNPPSLVRWNIDKHYLADLQACGVRTIPTVWLARDNTTSLRELCSALGSDDIVVKPTVSASAFATHRLNPATDQGGASVLLSDLRRRHELLAQPYIDTITSTGEWSLLFFGGKYSHSVRKLPAPGDFRVQVDFGGTIHAEAAPRHVRNAAAHVVQCLPASPLYARIDGVDVDGRFLLMEAECIDPVLYFASNPNGVTQFVDCLQDAMAGACRPTTPSPLHV